jgi:hypothetical protein
MMAEDVKDKFGFRFETRLVNSFENLRMVEGEFIGLVEAFQARFTEMMNWENSSE